jgi:cell division protein ZapA
VNPSDRVHAASSGEAAAVDPDGADKEGVLPVEILGQHYPIRSRLDEEYVGRLVEYVNTKIRAAADSTSSGDHVRFAVLAALNIADELFRCRDASSERQDRIAQRTGELERIVDRLLMV